MSYRIAYLMHVDWNWIKQRPHFLAEKLSDLYKVDLFYVKKYTDNNSIKNSRASSLKQIETLKKVPMSARYRLLRMAETAINHNKLKQIYNGDYTVIWITSPILLQFIDISRLNNSIIVYDCMDDVMGFPQKREIKDFIYGLEQQLIQRADFIFASSANLKLKMKERGSGDNVYVVNNAIERQSVFQHDIQYTNLAERKKLFSITYFGTIGEWVDFEAILEVVNTFDDVEIVLYGPKEIEIPSHPRIQYRGTVKHEELFNHCQMADAFIMPFKINELILSVDPVKVYEYIALHKPTIVVKYQETIKFNDYAYLYSNNNDLVNIVRELLQEPRTKSSKEATMNFINNNGWDERIVEVQTIIQKYIERNNHF
ncbi:glycosyltransferase [Paenibacillus agilis]|uniref:Glycosyltransferase family 1 protein n=1 Tax=Paenibacillus agilis TaxID=3020863 RepID=A0A559IPD2_9BACL|nr:glycosyltransferase [Paenibacillus agilis]TVX89403.1 glycosyltransferase family 1 protein [Paenibacillus agilis]